MAVVLQQEEGLLRLVQMVYKVTLLVVMEEAPERLLDFLEQGDLVAPIMPVQMVDHQEQVAEVEIDFLQIVPVVQEHPVA